jgi:hypothetical protein
MYKYQPPKELESLFNSFQLKEFKDLYQAYLNLEFNLKDIKDQDQMDKLFEYVVKLEDTE